MCGGKSERHNGIVEMMSGICIGIAHKQNKVIKPKTLPIEVTNKVGKKLITPVLTKVPATIITTSLGEGGKIFSMNEKKKRLV